MCRTSAPGRRELYELGKTLSCESQESAENESEPTGSFLLPKRPRIGTGNTTNRIEIFNGDYSPSGKRIGEFERPWNVLTPWDARMFPTYPEALTWALQEATK